MCAVCPPLQELPSWLTLQQQRADREERKEHHMGTGNMRTSERLMTMSLDYQASWGDETCLLSPETGEGAQSPPASRLTTWPQPRTRVSVLLKRAGDGQTMMGSPSTTVSVPLSRPVSGDGVDGWNTASGAEGAAGTSRSLTPPTGAGELEENAVEEGATIVLLPSIFFPLLALLQGRRGDAARISGFFACTYACI